MAQAGRTVPGESADSIAAALRENQSLSCPFPAAPPPAPGQVAGAPPSSARRPSRASRARRSLTLKPDRDLRLPLSRLLGLEPVLHLPGGAQHLPRRGLGPPPPRP